MKEFVIKVPDNCRISNLGFATSVVEKANTYTSDDINLKVSGLSYIDAKSILGLLSLSYNTSNEIKIQVIGENENYTAANFEKFLNKLVALYND